MSTLVRIIGFTVAGAIGLAALSFASPALAVPTTVDGCGDVPAGATLIEFSGVCELDITATGATSWTIPTGVTAIAVMLLGGGGGAQHDPGPGEGFEGYSVGYAGSGGQIIYRDNLTVVAGTTATVTVGAGGATVPSGAGTSGADTSFDLVTTTTALGGAGGIVTGPPDFCSPSGDFGVAAGNGISGAGGVSTDTTGANEGGDCALGYAPGANPGVDFDGAVVPNPPIMAFFGSTTVYGAGGRVVSAPETLSIPSTLIGSGRGADVLYTTGTISAADATGGSGRVIIRYLADSSGGSDSGAGTDTDTDRDTALATTGTDVLAPVALLSVLGAVGVAFLALARRRRSATSAAKR